MKPLGLVSNCWGVQLANDIALDELIAQATEIGYGAIELRQTCLGTYEPTAHSPIAEALAALPKHFPNMQFNLALAFPYLSAESSASHPLFAAAVEAADALSGKYPAHLRLVDLETPDEVLAGSDVEVLAERIAKLATPLIRLSGTLSIEHARQSWARTWNAFRAARERLDGLSSHLRLCYDPCNLFMASDTPRGADVLNELHPDDLSMVHFKQSVGGEQLTTVSDGQVNWPEQLHGLQAMPYEGPALFEVAASEDVWENLRVSQMYLDQHGLKR